MYVCTHVDVCGGMWRAEVAIRSLPYTATLYLVLGVGVGGSSCVTMANLKFTL